jgi:peptidoglycan/xylan/chitin deacetylase (PgdA/CDA1 family)
MTLLFLLLTLTLIGAARQAPAPKRKPIPPKTVALTFDDAVKTHLTVVAPLLIPTTGDAYPAWTFEHFKKVLLSAKPDEIIVLQFHGVPDEKHPWVNTPPAAFREYMTYLKQNGYRALALRDLWQYYDSARLPDDPLLKTRCCAK